MSIGCSYSNQMNNLEQDYSGGQNFHARRNLCHLLWSHENLHVLICVLWTNVVVLITVETVVNDVWVETVIVDSSAVSPVTTIVEGILVSVTPDEGDNVPTVVETVISVTISVPSSDVAVVFGVWYVVELSTDVEWTEDVVEALIKSVEYKWTVAVDCVVPAGVSELPICIQKKNTFSIFIFFIKIQFP